MPKPDTTATDTAACTALGITDFGAGIGSAIAGGYSDQLQFPAARYTPIPLPTTAAASSPVGTAITRLNAAVSTALVSRNAVPVGQAYQAAMSACAAAGLSTAPPGGTVAFDCTYRDSSAARPHAVVVSTYQEVWPIGDQMAAGVWKPCRVLIAQPYNETQAAALATIKATYTPSSGDDFALTESYSICMQPKFSGSAITSPDYMAKSNIATARGALVLCPDHPRAAEIQANIDAVQGEADALAAGELAPEGKHLVGKDIQPGTWQTQADQVTDCYWEISDAQGEIIDNNFISIAPKLTIEIPSSAAGFTNTGCGTFVKIG
jgi:hypothetical protein